MNSGLYVTKGSRNEQCVVRHDKIARIHCDAIPGLKKVS